MFNRFIPSIIFFPQYFYAAAVIITSALIILLLKLNKFNFKSKDFWLLAAPCLLLVFFTTLFLLFLNYQAVKHAVIIVIAALNYYFVFYLYYFLCRITKYTPLSLESLSSYFNVISFLFLGISFYGFINFLNLKVWYLAVLLIIITFILTYQFFWINKIGERQNFLASVLVSILLVEFFWSISFLPVSHFISGLSLTIIYYVLINTLLLHFLGKFDKKIIKMSFYPNVIIDSKVFAAIATKMNIPTTVKIWLEADLDIRAKRIVKRSKGELKDYENTLSRIRKELHERYFNDKRRYKKLYGIEYDKPELYNDIVIDITHLNEGESFNLLQELIKNGKYLNK